MPKRRKRQRGSANDLKVRFDNIKLWTELSLQQANTRRQPTAPMGATEVVGNASAELVRNAGSAPQVGVMV